MYRKSLALLATGLILFAALLVQMSIAQAAAPGQTTPDAAAEEPQPLPQPLRIRINQMIPLTISVPASLLANGASRHHRPDDHERAYKCLRHGRCNGRPD